MKIELIGCKPTFIRDGFFSRITGDKLVRDDYFSRTLFINAGLDTTYMHMKQTYLSAWEENPKNIDKNILQF